MKKRTLLREYREKAGISQSALAARTGIPQETISYYERGLEIPRNHADLLHQALQKILGRNLNIRPDDLGRSADAYHSTRLS